MNKLKFLSFLLVGFFVSCQSKVEPNEWVVSTGTCWNTMTVSKAGDYVPRLYTNCDRMIRLPAANLSMDFQVQTKFQGRVEGTVDFKGSWRITDPIKFIQNAKSITSSNTGDGWRVDPNALEAVENGVVDKMLADLIREYTPDKEPGIDELDVEKDIMKLAEQKLSDRGIEFSGPSMNITFTEQTEEALDAVSALKFYKANNEEELGRQIIKNKAGAPIINVKVVNDKVQVDE